jgi:uncharacterized membrane protein
VSAFREESEEHLVHRLEAFSDIIIGFSLAQMTLNLALPNDVLDLFAKHSQALAAFGLTFCIVAGMWWSHHRLFTSYFVPTGLNVVLNFLSLGGVMFLVYSLQVWIHSTAHRDVAYAMYSSSIAWVICIIAFLMYRGVILRGQRMKPEVAQLGRRRSIRVGIIGIAFACLAASAVFHSSRNVTGLVMLIAVCFVLILRFVENRRRSSHRTVSETGQ